MTTKKRLASVLGLVAAATLLTLPLLAHADSAPAPVQQCVATPDDPAPAPN